LSKLYIILVLAFIIRVTLALRDDANLTARLHNDDSFYLHTVSKNIGFGNGFTIDGKQLTNGVQPLVVVLNAPFYYVSSPNRWLGLRLSFIISSLVDCITIILLYKLLQTLTSDKSNEWTSPPLIGVLLWTFLYPVISQTMNGMETGLLSLFMMLALYLYSFFRKNNSTQPLSAKEYVMLGLTLGFLVLARIDTVIFCVILFFNEIYILRKRTSASVLLLPLLSFLISCPWWIYNVIVFGSLMPSSGTAESINGPSMAENVLRGATTLSDIVIGMMYLPYDKSSTLVKMFWIVLGIGVGTVYFLHKESKKIIVSIVSNSTVRILLIHGLILLLFYVLVFHAPYFLPRYLQPLRILGIICLSVLLSRFIKEKLVNTKLYQRILYAILSLVIITFNIIYYANNFFGKGMSELYYAGLWANAHKSAVVGMQQSGTAGFVADNIVNLDGKVNAEVLESMKQGKRGEYIANSNITHIADWYEFADVLRNEAKRYSRTYQLVDSFRLLRIYELVLPTTPQ
jgi:hypothetical protein